MKRIEFISPVEAMRGNLSGKQDLVYAENDNKAYEAPANQRNYARNYSPRFIGAKRSSDGRMYFAVKTKTATTITAASKRAMAVLGGVGAITAAILRRETYKAACKAQMDVENEQGYGWKSLRQFLDAKIRPELTAKSADIVIAPVGGTFRNPWVDGGTGIVLTIPMNTLTRLWSELANNPISYKVSSLKGVAHEGETFSELVASNHNSLDLHVVASGDDQGCVKRGELFVVYDHTEEEQTIKAQVEGGEDVQQSIDYYLSETKGENIG